MESNLCPRCGKPANGLYPSRSHGVLCFGCLDELEPEVVDRYDGWRDREIQHDKRRALAIKNFCTSPPPEEPHQPRGASAHHAPLPSDEGGLSL